MALPTRCLRTGEGKTSCDPLAILQGLQVSCSVVANEHLAPLYGFDIPDRADVCGVFFG